MMGKVRVNLREMFFFLQNVILLSTKDLLDAQKWDKRMMMKDDVRKKMKSGNGRKKRISLSHSLTRLFSLCRSFAYCRFFIHNIFITLRGELGQER